MKKFIIKITLLFLVFFLNSCFKSDNLSSEKSENIGYEKIKARVAGTSTIPGAK